MNKILLYTFLLCLFFLQQSFATDLLEKEQQYQKEADIVRIHHFDYYARLLEEYKNKKGHYPFQGKLPINTPLYIFIMTDEQEKIFYPENFLNISDTDFFKELEKVLGKKIEEKYDPQRISTGCPTMYMYMVNGDRMYFAIHLYYPNNFTRKNGTISDCYKMELSNIDNKDNKFFTYNFLKNNQTYKNFINTPITSEWFLLLEEKNKNNSRKNIIENKIPDEFYLAIQKGDIEYVRKTLRKNKYNLNPTYIEAKTNQLCTPLKPLYWAARTGQIEIAKILLEYGADINGLDCFQDTALITALENKQIEMVKFLIEQGADVNISTLWGISPFIGACATETPDMIKFMIKYGADLNKSFQCNIAGCKGKYNLSPLKSAEQNRQYSKEIIDILKRSGARK